MDPVCSRSVGEGTLGERHSGRTSFEAKIFGANGLTFVKDTFTSTCQYVPNGISVTRGRELIYRDVNSRTVNIVRHGKSETLITTPLDWRSWRLCCTRSGNILVNVYKGSGPQTKNKIIRN